MYFFKTTYVMRLAIVFVAIGCSSIPPPIDNQRPQKNPSSFTSDSIIIAYSGKTKDSSLVSVTLASVKKVLQQHYTIENPSLSLERIQHSHAKLFCTVSIVGLYRVYDPFIKGYRVHANIHGKITDAQTQNTLTSIKRSVDIKGGVSSIGIGEKKAYHLAVEQVSIALAQDLLQQLKKQLSRQNL